MKIGLPDYARLDQHPAHGTGDLYVSFYGEDRMTISVELLKLEEGDVAFSVSRGGITEGRFTREEFLKVLECASAMMRSRSH